MYAQGLLDDLDSHLRHAIVVEGKMDLEQVTNYDEIRAEIAEKLQDLRDRPGREEKPLIYHLDVAAMYPNIILTNRLQPPAIVTEEDCQVNTLREAAARCLFVELSVVVLM